MKIIENFPLNDTVIGSIDAVETTAPWDGGVTYALGDRVRVDSTHRLYESVQASNTNHDPTTDETSTWWIDIGPTNDRAMFDEYNETQTVRAGSINMTLNPSSRVTAMAFFNLVATSITIVFTDSIDGVVYDETLDLTSAENINDIYDYFFAPIIRRTDVFLSSFPFYTAPTIEITIANAEGAAKCGKLVMGSLRDTGTTQQGAEFGIIDQSRVQTDDFGNTTIIQRSFRKRISLDVMIEASNVDEVGRLLADRRAVPTVFVGSTRYGQTLVDGIPREWRVALETWPLSRLTIDIEGLR